MACAIGHAIENRAMLAAVGERIAVGRSLLSAGLRRPPYGATMSMLYQSPASLLRMAFGVQADQIINTPAWASSERFDINAKVAPGIVFNAMTMFQPLMRKLLEDRFHLKIHHETRELNVYRLVRVHSDRLGPKLAAAPANVSDDLYARLRNQFSEEQLM